MLTHFGALDAGVPVMPIAVPVVGELSSADLAAAELDSLDTLIAELDQALGDRDAAARRVVILEQRIALARTALLLHLGAR